MVQVNGRGRLSTPHSCEDPQPIFMNFEKYHVTSTSRNVSG